MEKFRKRPNKNDVVYAEQYYKGKELKHLMDPFYVVVNGNKVELCEGDWVVENEVGEVRVMVNSAFKSLYEKE